MFLFVYGQNSWYVNNISEKVRVTHKQKHKMKRRTLFDVKKEIKMPIGKGQEVFQTETNRDTGILEFLDIQYVTHVT